MTTVQQLKSNSKFATKTLVWKFYFDSNYFDEPFARWKELDNYLWRTDKRVKFKMFN